MSSIFPNNDPRINQEESPLRVNEPLDRSARLLESLKRLNVIFVRPTAEGAITAAAIASISNEQPIIIFQDDYSPIRFDLTRWEPSKFLILNIDLNKSTEVADSYRRMLGKFREHGHSLVGICDEHAESIWREILQSSGFRIDHMDLKPPEIASAYDCSATILMQALDKNIPEHAATLCKAAVAAANELPNEITQIFRQVMRSKPRDSGRPQYLIRHFSKHLEPDDLIKGWIEDYKIRQDESIKLANQSFDLGNGIALLDLTNAKLAVDFKTVSEILFNQGSSVIVFKALNSEGEPLLYIRTNRAELDLSSSLAEHLTGKGIVLKNRVYANPSAESECIKIVRDLLVDSDQQAS